MNLALLGIISAALQAAPTVVAGVEYLVKEAPPTTKQQLALDALIVATAGAKAALPADSDLADSLSNALSVIIETTVAGFNELGIFTHKVPATTEQAAA